MSDPQANNNSDENKNLADALRALSEGADTPEADEESDVGAAPIAEGFDFNPLTGRAFRPSTPQRSKPADRAPTPAPAPEPAAKVDFERIVETEEVAVPAPSAESLASSNRLRGTVGAQVSLEDRARSVQRTIIPILLTLALLCIGVGCWFLSLPADSLLRATIEKLHVYLFIAAPVFTLVAAVNMVQVRRASQVR